MMHAGIERTAELRCSKIDLGKQRRHALRRQQGKPPEPARQAFNPSAR
jgi:hypothetical protein